MACEEIVDDEITEFDSFNNPDIMVSAKTTRLFKRELRIALFKETAGYKIIKKSLVACIIAFALLVVTVVAVEPVRTKFFDVVTKWYSDCVELIYNVDESEDYPKYLEEIYLPILPNDWRIESVDPAEKHSGYYRIITSDGNKIFYSQLIVGTDSSVDNTKHNLKYVQLNNGIQATLFEFEDGFTSLMWEDDYIFVLESFEVSTEELIKLANTIK
jgi:hypothetical protein